MMEPMSLAGKKIVITGASSGIGRATAIYCAGLGAKVVLLDRNQEGMEKTCCAMSGEGHSTFLQDLSKDEGFEDLFDSMISDGQKLDGMVHCAGIPGVMPLKSLTQERLHTVMGINFYSFVELSRYFTKKKYSNDAGSIVGISSSVVLHPRMYELAYVASKAAMEAAAQVMALECGKRRIRVNCVSPGSVRTEMIERALAEQSDREALDAAANQAIFGWQQPEDIAKVCAFLLSDMSASITARVIRADGGFM